MRYNFDLKIDRCFMHLDNFPNRFKIIKAIHFLQTLIYHHTMRQKYMMLFVIFFLFLGVGQVFAWIEYKPVIFVGDMSQIYSRMPVFHGYTSEFLNSQDVKQVCTDSSHDEVKLNYCT